MIDKNTENRAWAPASWGRSIVAGLLLAISIFGVAFTASAEPDAETLLKGLEGL